jgi:hypothetical protein
MLIYDTSHPMAEHSFPATPVYDREGHEWIRVQVLGPSGQTRACYWQMVDTDTLRDDQGNPVDLTDTDWEAVEPPEILPEWLSHD